MAPGLTGGPVSRKLMHLLIVTRTFLFGYALTLKP